MITLQEYLAIDAVSFGSLKAMAKSAAHYQAYLNQPATQTAALNFGSAAHAMILQPRENLVAIMPEGIDKRTKAGKETFAEFQACSAGKIIITCEEAETINGMIQAINQTIWAKSLLSKGLAEQTFQWIDPETGLPCKSRFDRIYETLVIDYKTTVDASFDGFQRQAIKYGYHLQPAHYLAGLPPESQFVFVAQEKEPPYAVSVFNADGDFLEYGRAERNRLMKQIMECKETETYPGYPDKIQPLYLPGWVKRKDEIS